MELGASSVLEVVKGVTEAFAGKSMSLRSDRISTKLYKCEKGKCQWRQKQHTWLIDRRYNFPFKKWTVAEVWLHITFEYDGCDVHNARLVPSGKSFNRWYNDKSTFDIVAQGALSKLTDSTGCENCCKEAAVVEFDVVLNTTSDYLRTAQRSFKVTVSGNGSVRIVEI